MLHCALNIVSCICSKCSSHIAIIRTSLRNFRHLFLIQEENNCYRGVINDIIHKLFSGVFNMSNFFVLASDSPVFCIFAGSYGEVCTT